MAMRRSSIRLLLQVILTLSGVAALLAGCGGDDATDEELLGDDPAEILAASAQAMGDITSVRFEIDQEGASVHIDPADTIEFDAAVGEFAAPRSAQAILTVVVGGSLRTELGAIAIDDEAWLQTALTGWDELPESYGLDPAMFFDPKGGWRPLLAELADPELVDAEPVDGRPTRHLRGTASAERISTVTAELVDEPVIFDVWIDATSALVSRASFTVDIGGEPADWEIRLSGYGEEVVVEPPEIE